MKPTWCIFCMKEMPHEMMNFYKDLSRVWLFNVRFAHRKCQEKFIVDNPEEKGRFFSQITDIDYEYEKGNRCQ